MTLIKKRWPFWIKLLVAPVAITGMIVTLPVTFLLAFADFDKSEAIMNFWTDQE